MENKQLQRPENIARSLSTLFKSNAENVVTKLIKPTTRDLFRPYNALLRQHSVDITLDEEVDAYKFLDEEIPLGRHS